MDKQELKCPACKTTLFCEYAPKYLCPFCGARFAESEPSNITIRHPPTAEDLLRKKKLKKREWVNWLGAPENLTWLVSWAAGKSVLHAHIMEREMEGKKKCWDYSVWTKVEGRPIARRGVSYKSMADAKKCCLAVLRDAGDAELVELPSRVY